MNTVKNKRLLVSGLVLAPLTALGLGVGAACVSHRPVDLGLVNGRLQPCPSSPNCVVSEPEGNSSIAPLAFSGDPIQAFRSLVDFLEAQSNAEILVQREGYVHAVYYSSLFRFADDVEFRLDPESKVIHVRSASRIGYSDLGANRSRVEAIRRDWTPPDED